MASTGESIIQDQDVRGALIQDVHQRFVVETFKDLAMARATGTPFGNPTGTAGDVNTLLTRDNMFQYHVLGTQTILGPAKVDTGLDITQDVAAADDGVEYTLGCEEPANTVIADTAGATRGTFVVGTDAPFYVSVKFNLDDVSGTDDCAVGFRKAEAYQAAIDNYDEMAVLNMISGDINIETILNNAATVTTDTTDNWADAATHTFTVIVDSDGSLTGNGTVGRVYYEIDGVKPTTLPTANFKFDSGEIVIPFLYFIQNTDLCSIVLQRWESGFIGVGDTEQRANG